MDSLIFLIILFCSCVLLAIGFFRSQFIFILFAGIGFILSGVVMFTGIQYIDFTTVETIAGVTTITDHFSQWNNDVTKGIGIFLALIGFFLLVMSAIGVFSGKTKWWEHMGNKNEDE